MTSILHLITSVEGGGTENFLTQLLAASPPGISHRVRFLGKDGPMGDRIRSLGISLERTSPPALWRELKANPPKILHTLLYWGNQVGRLVGSAAGVHPIISTQRAIATWEKPWHGWLDRLTLPTCDAIIANSEAARQLIERRCRNKRPPVHVIHNGIDTHRFTRLDPQEARRSYGLPPDAQVGGTLMRLHAEKGAHWIPRFAASLMPRAPALHLLIGGVGSMEAALKTEIGSYPWSDRVHWVGWEPHPARLLSASDFFWSLAREESFPQSLLEASALACPWVAPRVGGVPELQQQGAYGLLYEPGNPSAGADTCATLLSDLSAHTAKAQQAASTVRSRFSMSEMAKRVYDVFDRAAQNA